jgi:hypothetical protein
MSNPHLSHQDSNKLSGTPPSTLPLSVQVSSGLGDTPQLNANDLRRLSEDNRYNLARMRRQRSMDSLLRKRMANLNGNIERSNRDDCSNQSGAKFLTLSHPENECRESIMSTDVSGHEGNETNLKHQLSNLRELMVCQHREILSKINEFDRSMKPLILHKTASS